MLDLLDSDYNWGTYVHTPCIHRPSPPGKVRVLKLVDVIKTELSKRGAYPAEEASHITAMAAGGVHLMEIKQIVDLATAFPGECATCDPGIM